MLQLLLIQQPDSSHLISFLILKHLNLLRTSGCALRQQADGCKQVDSVPASRHQIANQRLPEEAARTFRRITQGVEDFLCSIPRLLDVFQ